MVITRIVVPNNNESKDSAIMYLAYTGYTINQGNGAWNRNITYVDANDLNGDLWDKQYNELVIDLSKVNGDIRDTGISKDSNYQDILDKSLDLSKYIADNYIIGFENFTVVHDNDWTHVSTWKFKEGKYEANANPTTDKTLKSSTLLKNETATTDVLLNNDNVIQIKFFLDLGKDSEGKVIELLKSLPDSSKDLNSYEKYNNTYGFWKAFYIVGYKSTK